MQRSVLVKKILIVVGALVIVALLALGFIVVRDRFFSSGELEMGGAVDIPEGAQLSSFGDGYIFQNGGELVCLGKDGQEKWSLALTDPNASAAAASGYIAVYQNESLSFFGADGAEQYIKPLNLVAAGVRCGTGNVAILNADRTVIYVLSSKGSLLDTIAYSGQTVVDYGFYSSSDLLWVISLDTSGAVPTSVVSVYDNINKTTVAMQQFVGEVVYDLAADRSTSSVLAIGTHRATPINISGGSAAGKGVLVYGYDYAAGSVGGTLVFAESEGWKAGSTDRIRIVNGSAGVNLILPTACEAFLVTDEYIYAMSGEYIYTLSLSGSVIKTESLSVVYDSVTAYDCGVALFRKNGGALMAKAG